MSHTIHDNNIIVKVSWDSSVSIVTTLQAVLDSGWPQKHCLTLTLLNFSDQRFHKHCLDFDVYCFHWKLVASPTASLFGIFINLMWGKNALFCIVSLYVLTFRNITPMLNKDLMSLILQSINR